MKNRKRLFILLGVLCTCGLLYTGLLHYKISQFTKIEAPDQADYLIVLGAKVNGTVPSLALASRINAAADYLTKNQETIVIASGGQGRGEDISEAESIKSELMIHGIDESRIIVENRSTSTYENIKYSKKLLPAEAKAGIVVTNDFHLYRAVSIARSQELTIHGLPAKTPPSAIVKSYIREYMAITKYYIERYVLKNQ